MTNIQKKNNYISYLKKVILLHIQKKFLKSIKTNVQSKSIANFQKTFFSIFLELQHRILDRNQQNFCNNTDDDLIIKSKNFLIQNFQVLNHHKKRNFNIQQQRQSFDKMHKKCLKVINLVILMCFLLTLTVSDIRIDNNQLSAEGHWEINVNKETKKDTITTKQEINKQNETTQKSNEIKNETKSDQVKNMIEQQENWINIFQQFSGNSGSCFIFFYDSNLRDSFQNKQKVDSLSIRFHDPKYIDQKIIVLKVALQNYISDSDDWEISTAKVNYTYFDELELQRHGSMQISYTVSKDKIHFLIGDYELSINYKKKQYSIVFPIVILALCFLTLYGVIRFEKREMSVQRISIITLYHNVFFFIYLSTFFMIIGMAALPEPMSILLLCGCILILISVKLIRKFQTIIQRVSNIDGYCFFYCGIFLYVWCLFNYYYTPLFIITNSLFLLPQIIHNARFGNRLGNQYEYLVILASPQIYFLYLKGYPDNVLRYHPQPWVCAIVVLLIMVQLITVHFQNVRGPYFFIRKEWLPNYFNYYQTFKLDSKCDLYEHQCPICLCSLAEQDPVTVQQLQTIHKTQDELNPKNIIISAKQIRLMVTPCQHKFHPRCLQEWIQYKRQCPVDRSSLPMLYN